MNTAITKLETLPRKRKIPIESQMINSTET
jgi:hypothetical protein